MELLQPDTGHLWKKKKKHNKYAVVNPTEHFNSNRINKSRIFALIFYPSFALEFQSGH